MEAGSNSESRTADCRYSLEYAEFRSSPVILDMFRMTRVFLATKPTHMRQKFNGLFRIVENVIRETPFSRHLFLIRSCRRDDTHDKTKDVVIQILMFDTLKCPATG